MAFQMVHEGLKERKLPFCTIDLSGGEHLRAEGRFSLKRFCQLLMPIFKAAFLLLTGRRVLYLSATQNWIGFCRDSVFILLAVLRGSRVVIHVHGGNYDGFYNSLCTLRRYLIRTLINRVDRILILGDSLRGMFDFEPRLRRKLRVVFNGLPYSAQETALKPKSLSQKNGGRPRLLFLSNLIVSKGYLDVLEAVRILVYEKDIDLECHFCGSFVMSSDVCPYSNPEEAEADFLDRIQEKGLGGHVLWHGPVVGNEKLQVLNNCHFFVLPTNYIYEGQPISIIEALAFGLVVISTPHRTIPEMLKDGEAGEFVRFGRPEEIACVIKSYIQEPEKFEAMSRSAIEQYRQAFTREVHLDKLVSCIVR